MSDKPSRPTRSTGNSRSQRILDSMRVIATGVTHREGGGGASAMSSTVSSITLAIAALANKLRGITPTMPSINIDSNLDIPIQIPGPRGLRGLTGTNGTIGVNGKPGRPGFDLINDDNPIQNGVPGVRGPAGAAGARGRSGAQAAPALDPNTDLAIPVQTPGLRGAAGAVGASGATGSMSLIAESILSADAADVTFSAIPQTFSHLMIVLNGRGTSATSVVGVAMQFNGDTAANYDSQTIVGANTTLTGAALQAQTSTRIGIIPDSSATRSTQAGMCKALIPAYAGATYEKQWAAESAQMYSTTAGTRYAYSISGGWRSASPITSIRVFPEANNFKAGTVVSLYGIGTGTAASSVTPVWDLTVNEDGSSLSNWTQVAGSWSVASSAFTVTGTALGYRTARMTSRLSQSAIVFEADVKMLSTGGFAADNRVGLVFNMNSSITNGSLVCLRSTGALNPASTGTIYNEQPTGVTAGPSGLTFLFNLDTYYNLRVVAIGPVMDIYVDGVYKYTVHHKVDTGTPSVEYAYVGLFTYNASGSFKNIKMYRAALPNTSAVTLKLDDCANPDDNTDLNASTTAHGLLKKLDGTAGHYMDGTGAWTGQDITTSASPTFAKVLAPALSLSGRSGTNDAVTTEQDLTNCSLSLTRDGVWLVLGTFNHIITAGTNSVYSTGKLNFDGSNQTETSVAENIVPGTQIFQPSTCFWIVTVTGQPKTAKLRAVITDSGTGGSLILGSNTAIIAVWLGT